MSNNLSAELIEFLSYLQNDKGATTLTVKNYQFYLNRFLNWSQLKTPSDITVEKIDGFRFYLGSLRSQSGELMKQITQNYHLIALRSFLEYLAKKGTACLPPDKIILNKTQKKDVVVLGSSELERLLNAPLQSRERGLIQKRDKAILELLFGTGLKVSEMAALRQDSIDFQADELMIKGAERKVRSVPLGNQVKYWLKEYLKMRTDSFPALFIRHDKAKRKQFDKIDSADYKLAPRTIQRIIKKYCHSAGLPANITPETLRQTYANYLLSQGYDLNAVQNMLGHASITTTKLYTTK